MRDKDGRSKQSICVVLKVLEAIIILGMSELMELKWKQV